MGKKVDKLKPGPYDFVRVDSQEQIDVCLNCEKKNVIIVSQIKRKISMQRRDIMQINWKEMIIRYLCVFLLLFIFACGL